MLGEYVLPISVSEAQFPFAAGNASLVCSEGVLYCFFDTEWTKDRTGDGQHHQGSELLMIDTQSMKLIWEP